MSEVCLAVPSILRGGSLYMGMTGLGKIEQDLKIFISVATGFVFLS